MHAAACLKAINFGFGGYCAARSERVMSVWGRLVALVGSVSERTGIVGSLANALDPDNWLPGGRDAAFTLALIALSAKMAVSDGVVTASELRAFQRTVEIPPGIEQQVDKLFKLAQQDVAGPRAEESGQHPQRRGLPGPVGAQHHRHLSRPDREADVIEHDVVREIARGHVIHA